MHALHQCIAYVRAFGGQLWNLFLKLLLLLLLLLLFAVVELFCALLKSENKDGKSIECQNTPQKLLRIQPTKPINKYIFLFHCDKLNFYFLLVPSRHC